MDYFLLAGVVLVLIIVLFIIDIYRNNKDKIKFYKNELELKKQEILTKFKKDNN